MTLTVGDGTTLEGPANRQIEAALVGLEGARDPFLILSNTDGAFVQAYGTPTAGFVLEYRPATGQHIRARNPAVALSTVAAALEAFASGSRDPLRGLDCVPVQLLDTDQGSRELAPWTVGVGLLAILAVWMTPASDAALVRVVMGYAAAVFGSMVVDALRSGRVYVVALVTRKSHPVAFRLSVAWYAFLAVVMVAMTLVP
jgi:hypothetical protein